ncbi:protein dispatched homolog 3-like [Mizuhopecten yessoensis]|uniref:Patched domain-containing protein 2 n=1 Tax=Mizuhopecten yessoensis TaxID=6573 RepID=A0A210R534_MIZYE|nr:protein dispatched homolog 3-like [Mizuhopecten yessoensis]OWF56167.1 Patched domain-containing protein 2 [Mizuhopecten yessoensis]
MSCLLTTCGDTVHYNQVPLDDYCDDSTESVKRETTHSRDQLTCIQKLNCNLSRQNNCTCCNKKIGKCCEASVIGLFVSIALLIITPAICAALFYYSLFVLQPTLVIDKSIHAFTIPNHPASLNYDAFKVATQHNSSRHSIPYGRCDSLFSGRHRRSVQSGRENLKLVQDQSISHMSNRKTSEDLSKQSLATHNILRSLSKRSASDSDSFSILSRVQYHAQWKMQVVFMAKGEEDGNVFTRERLEMIHDIEQRIISHPDFYHFCLKDYTIAHMDPAVRAQNSCAPLNSLMSFFYPSLDDQNRPLFDGLGKTLIKNISEGLQWAFTSDKSYYFVDPHVNKTFHKSRFLRTEVKFGTPLQGYNSPYFEIKQQSEKFKAFVVTYIDLLSKLSNNKLQVLYGGTEIFDYQVDSTFWNDVKMAYITMICICVIMMMLTFSVWLTFWGVASIVMCFPLALFLYRFVFGISALGILNGVAAFVIIGIGVDDVFVFVNIFRQSSGQKSVSKRIRHTMLTAGKATFFTSFTTTAAFAANVFSSIPAVHQFGLFMSLIVSCCWVTVMLIMPPALYIWALSIYKCEEAVARLISRCLGRSKSALSAKLCLPADIARFVRGQTQDNTSPPSWTCGQDSPVEVADSPDEDDVPLLMMDDPMQEYFDAIDDDDEALLDATLKLDDQKEDLLFSKMLQGFTFHGIARPVTHIRRGVLVLSLVVLCVSVGLMVQLTPATRPPQLFQSDTNLQMLLDLKSNLSVDTIFCPRCSAIYSMNPAYNRKRPNRPSHRSHPVVTPHITTAHVTVPPLQSTTKEVKPPIVKTRKPTPKTITSPKSPPVTRRPRPSTPKPVVPNTDAALHWTPGPPRSSVPVKGQGPEGVSVCQGHDCSNTKDRPMLESGAVVHVVFGIKGIDRSNVPVGHVLDQTQGTVDFDSKFSKFFSFDEDLLSAIDGIKTLCRICQRIANESSLVRKGSAQCFPPHMACLDEIPECRDLQQTQSVYGRQAPAHYAGGLTANKTGLLWWAFAFESTTPKGISYFEAYKHYLKWETLIEDIKSSEHKHIEVLDSMFQTSQFWTKVLMEVVAVNSAIYGLVLSMVVCMVAVALFTGHVLLLFIVFICILQMICLVVGVFYMAGWEMGGVEAISLSILVGSSVDYCVHLVEGYLLAGKALPQDHKQSASSARRWRTKAAITHIGVSILSSALTTIVAAIPLTQTIIKPFAKFGQIVAINTSVSIVYSLTVCSAFLATIAPGYFIPTWKSHLKALAGTVLVLGATVLSLYGAAKAGVFIPGPNGEALFPN